MSEHDPAAVAAAMAVLDDHMAALNARDEAALAATLHFPHYRLTGGQMKICERSDSYLRKQWGQTPLKKS